MSRARLTRAGCTLAIVAGCSAGSDKPATPPPLGNDAGSDTSTLDVTGIDDVSPTDGAPPVVIPDPTTCAEAAAGHTYVGCDFWPTVTDNMVRPDFDYAVVVANTGSTEADVAVTRDGKSVATAKVAPNGLQKIFLPWVDALKGTSVIAPGCPSDVKLATVRAKGGAYHLTSSIPVAVYQFNAIEYAGKGGPPGKDWTTICKQNCFGLSKGCFSYTNDASLLLPATALTGNYRVAGPDAWAQPPDPSTGKSFTMPPYFVVTGTKDATTVTVTLPSTAGIVAGGGIAGTSPGGTATFIVGEGEVVEIIGTSTSDFSGALVKASAPIQVISGIACSYMPHDREACDHLEETLLPVETLGKHYFVTAPSGPTATRGQIVRLVGNVDGTKLTYPGIKPSAAPTTIAAGELVNLGQVDDDFEIVGDHELTVMTFQLGAGPVSAAAEGDPSQSFSTAVEQYRLKYIFLAPDDYDTSFADIVQPMDATLTLDGAAVSAKPKAMSSGFGVTRVKLGPGKGGAHVLTATAPVGLQVLGYGSYTSYQYPGGLNLGHIAPTPIK